MSNPKKPTDIGANRTGSKLRPGETKKTLEGARQGVVTRSFDVTGINQIRRSLSEVVEPVGTMPPPSSLKGLAKAGLEAMKGNNPMVFLDLLSDRLVFERTAVRMYEAFMVKLEAAHVHPGGPTMEEVAVIRDDELRHMGMLLQTIEDFGADPTVLTPTADICAVATAGVLQVLTDPRTTLTHALHALQIAELTDNDAWLLLTDLAEHLGHEEMANNFRLALADEDRHLDDVRSWLATSIDEQAGVESSAEQPASPLPPP